MSNKKNRVCGTCKYWAGNDKIHEAHHEHHPCSRIKHDKDWSATPDMSDSGLYRYLDEKEKKECFDSMAATDDAVVQDGSGYVAALKTRKSFGCVFHEEIED